jgi:hypothetical protein
MAKITVNISDDLHRMLDRGMDISKICEEALMEKLSGQKTMDKLMEIREVK